MRSLRSLITGQPDEPEETPVTPTDDPWQNDWPGDPTTANLQAPPTQHRAAPDAGANPPVVHPEDLRASAADHVHALHRPGDTGTQLAAPVRAAADANAEADEDADDTVPCPTCGALIPPVRHYLSDTLSLVATRAPLVFSTFYGRLFVKRPDLADMFPEDLADPDSDPSGAGHAQREKLVAAATAVASHFNPSSPRSMVALNKALDDMGAKHGESRFTVADENWPSGRRPLLLKEYDVVDEELIDTLAEFQGESWTPQHHAAWWTALSYVSARMFATQILAAPRHAK
jgi:hemoglobin-like flavoprotein